ncbi:MAG: protein kinase [Deltaproteobacteria bacterium]|nr:protein kinase [Deltaproteobacteria bacterium]
MSASSDGGIRFGQYVLLRRIARGGMAEVFLAQQKGLEGFDRRVAVKRILPHLADAPDFLKMFLKEAQLAAQLTHPNIVHIYDFGKVDQDYFIAMEFVDGVHAGQLYKYGVEKERLSPTMVARIGADAATALHYAHELRNNSGKPLGLVHRDVSPANIMVSFDGVVKLCDFGIAKAAALGDQLTNPGQVKGKYAYMSPEQTIAAPLDGRSDVFSLAIVLWELLAGKTIVGRTDTVDAMRAIRDGKLEPIAKAAPHTPPALAKALTWALQTRRETRATAMDFAQALEQFIKSSPELATPMQLGGWVRQRFAREGTTGPHNALSIPGVSIGTRASPGTQIVVETAASPGTAVSTGTRAGTVTPPASMIAASVVAGNDVLETAETVAITGEDKAPAPARRDSGGRKTPAPTQPPPLPRMKAQEDIPAFAQQTMLDPSARAAAETTERDGELVHESSETQMHGNARKPLVAGGPAELPTMIAPPPPFERKRTPVPMDVPERIPRRARLALAVGGLVLLAVLSFVIALAARGSNSAAPADAAERTVAIAPDAAPIDAAIDAPLTDAPSDGLDPTIRPDAQEELTYLEIRTSPPGGSVTISGETRADPAKFALAPGQYKILAELDGYAPERREVLLEKGVDRVQDIAFRKRAITGNQRPAPAMGKLTARTTPYSVVYSGAKRIGETPFAEVELPAGTYKLTFKHPSKSPVTKKVVITAGKTTKVSFAIP